MTMKPGLRAFALTVHVISSVGFFGAVAVFLALAVAGLTSQQGQIVRAAYIAMELATWFVIVPFSFASLLTGVVQALGTAWGLFRHYWVLVKLILTLLTVIVLLIQTPAIHVIADLAANTVPGPEFVMVRTSLVIHASGGLLVLLTMIALSVYKPRGLTRYG